MQNPQPDYFQGDAMHGFKLIRDYILDIISNKGESLPKWHYAKDRQELNDALEDKLLEETEEFLNAKDDDSRFAELVDILEVLRALARQYGRSVEQLQEQANEKLLERGGFRLGILARFEPRPSGAVRLHITRQPPKGTKPIYLDRLA